jgi:hypothetical protein
MRLGTVAAPKGAVAFFGTSSTISSGAHLRGEVFEGFAQQFYADTCNDIAKACEAGRKNQFSLYGDTAQYTSHILYGDPEMDIRTKVPSTLTVTHETVMIKNEANSVTVNVRNGATAVRNALVCIMLSGDFHTTARTNASGNAVFSITPTDTGTASVTVTAKNFLPYEGTARIIINGPFMSYQSNTINDSRGNSDGYLNPGEDVDIQITLRNSGTTTASSVTATLISADPYVTLISPTANYGNIAASASQTRTFRFSIARTTPKEHTAVFSLNIADGSGNTWTSNNPSIPVNVADINYVSCTVIDTAPGEMAMVF